MTVRRRSKHRSLFFSRNIIRIYLKSLVDASQKDNEMDEYHDIC